MNNKPKFWKIGLPLATGTLAMALLAACGGPASQSAPAAQPQVAPASSSAPAGSAPAAASAPSVATPPASQAAAPATTADIGLAKAKEIALQSAGVAAANASFTQEKPGMDDGIAVYDIEFVAGGQHYSYEIAATDGSVREASQEPVAQGATATAGQISADQAKAAALNAAGLSENQVTITKLSLEHDDGRAEYDVEFTANGTQYSYTIDAVSGAVLEAEQEKGR